MTRYVSVLSVFVLIAFSLPAFAVWPPAIRLTDGPNENINPDIFVPEQALPHETLVLVWQRSRPGGWDIYYRENGGGTTWSAPQLVSSLPDSNLTPAIAAYNRYRYCVWVNCHGDSQNILCSRWSGGAWAAPVNLTQDTFPNSEPAVWCAEAQDSAAVVWASLRNGLWSLYSRFFNGTAWSPVIPVVTDSGNNRRPCIDKNFYRRFRLCWQSDTGGNGSLLLSHFVSGAWTPPQAVTRQGGADIFPGFVKGMKSQRKDWVELLWSGDSVGNYEVFGTNPDSTPFPLPERITNHDSSDTEPSALNHGLYSSPSGLWLPMLIAWTSQRDGNANIYAMFWTQEVVDTNPAVDRHPCVTTICPNDYLYEWIIWESNRDGNWNLYGSYKMQWSGGVEAGEGTSSWIPSKPKGFKPSPFHPPGSMTLFLPDVQSNLSLKFYDSQGRCVGMRTAERKAPGQYELSWDGRDQQGHPLPSGPYFLKPEGTLALFRIVLLR
jgi:hypothetical protein